MALTGWLFPLLFCSASFRITISLAVVTVQEPYAHHFALSCFSQHHPQTFLCSYLSLLLFISAYSLGCLLLFSLISSAGLWNIAEPVSAAQQACPWVPFLNEALSSHSVVKKHSSEGWVILQVRCFVNFSHKQICCFPGSQLDVVFLDHNC